MKNYLYILFITFLAFSCKKDLPVDYAVITGNFENNTSDPVILSGINDRSYRKKIKLSDDGAFNDTIKGEKGLYQINYKKKRSIIYLENGFNLNINAKLESLNNTIIFKGQGSAENNFIRLRTKTAKKLEGTDNIYLLEEDAIKEKLDLIVTSLNELLENTQGISANFRLDQQKDIKYTYLIKLINYEFYHGHYAKKRGFKTKEGFLDELHNLDYNNQEDYENSRAYKYLVGTHYKNKADSLRAAEKISKDIALLKTYSTITNKTIKNDLLNSLIVNLNRTKNLEEFYKLFMQSSTDEKKKQNVTDLYNNLKLLQVGNLSPKFENYENHKGGTTSLDDLKGKYVYVDVWATWCGPCTKEIPYLKEIEKAYHGKDIEFVSISVDKEKDHDKWKTMVSEKELGGIQLFADNSFKSKFIKDYAINSIPRFLLIDPEGNIVDANASRPSNKRLVVLFDELGI